MESGARGAIGKPLFAAHHKLNSLLCIIDYNKLQSLATVDETLRLEPFRSKFEAFGWSVHEIDGHDHTDLARALSPSSSNDEKPTVVIAHTVKGKGVSFMENRVEWHYRSPTQESLARRWLKSREQAMRDAFIDQLTSLAEIHPQIALIVGDLGYNVVEEICSLLPRSIYQRRGRQTDYGAGCWTGK